VPTLISPYIAPLFAAFAATLVLTSAASAASWSIKFPSLSTEETVETTTPKAMSRLCKGQPQRTKSLGFERPAEDESIRNIAIKQSLLRAPFAEVTVRYKGRGKARGRACTLQLKNVLFTHWTIQAFDVGVHRKAMELFTIAYSQAALVQ
jgi:hypothetical protein